MRCHSNHDDNTACRPERETLLLVLHIPSRHTTTKRLIEEALPKTEVLLLLLLLGNQRKTGKKFGTNKLSWWMTPFFINFHRTRIWWLLSKKGRNYMTVTKADSVVQLDQNFLVFCPRWRSFLCGYSCFPRFFLHFYIAGSSLTKMMCSVTL